MNQLMWSWVTSSEHSVTSEGRYTERFVTL